MDLSNLTVIRSTDAKIPTAETASAEIPTPQAKTTTKLPKEQQIPIDNKFIDKATISADKELQATVLAKQPDGKVLLELSNGKQLELKLPAELNLKVMDKVFLQVENSQITNIQVKDVAQSLNLNNNDLLKLINSLQNLATTKNLAGNSLPLVPTQTQDLKAPLGNNLSLNVIPQKVDDSAILQALKAVDIPKEFNLQSQSIELTVNNKPVSLPIEKIEFPQAALKNLIQTLQNNLPAKMLQEFSAKVVQQQSPQNIQVAVKENLNLELNLAKPETISNNLINLKPSINPQTNQLQLIKPDSANIIESIKVEPQVLKQIIQPLKTLLVQDIITTKNAQVENNLTNLTNIPAVIKDNKIILPSLNNLSLKLPVKAENILPQTPKTELTQPIKAKVSFVQNNNKIELVLTSQNQTIKLDNLELELNNKLVNTVVNNLLQNSNVSNISPNNITLKSADFFEIILNVKNTLSDSKNLSFNLQADNKLHLVYPEKTLENPISQAKQAIAGEALPHLAKQFAPQLSIMLGAAIVANKQSQIPDKDSDIFTLLLDSLPDQHKPNLQISQQNEGWKFFNFPYYQEDNQQKNGQAFYSNTRDESGNQQTNLAIKVNFSNIGDVMLKIKMLNKNIDINIYTQIDIKESEKQNLTSTIQQKLAESGFLGTVGLKKEKTFDIPLLNSEKIVYSSLNIKV